MDLDDQEKTSFVTAQGTYYYRVMPFGLKNAGATYQRLVNRMFQKQIGVTMEVYIDDMLVKSTTAELHIAHLSEAFQILRNYNMKLNPAKCAFGVSAGKFLGFIVNHRGIEASRQNKGCARHSVTVRYKGSPATDRKDCGFEPVRIQSE